MCLIQLIMALLALIYIEKYIRQRAKAMDLSLLLLKVMITIALLGFFSKLIQICDALILKPERLRSKLRKQGIRGPPPSILLGNINDIKKMKSTASKTQPGEQALTHNCSSAVFPFFDLWRKQYGN